MDRVAACRRDDGCRATYERRADPERERGARARGGCRPPLRRHQNLLCYGLYRHVRSRVNKHSSGRAGERGRHVPADLRLLVEGREAKSSRVETRAGGPGPVEEDAPPEPETVDTGSGDDFDDGDATAEPCADACAPELRALFDSNLLSDRRVHAGRISALAASLEAHPAVRTPRNPSPS